MADSLVESIVSSLIQLRDAKWSLADENMPDDAQGALNMAIERLREVEVGEVVFHLRSYGDVSAADLDRITSRTPTDAALRGLVGKWRAESDSAAEAADMIWAGKALAYGDCADELEALVGKEGG